jgi:hypothetical protein
MATFITTTMRTSDPTLLGLVACHKHRIIPDDYRMKGEELQDIYSLLYETL